MPAAADLDGVLDQARRHVGLTHHELWLRYFELGGMSSPLELKAYLRGALRITAHDHDVIAVALNERSRELGGDGEVPYSDDDAMAEQAS